jgi:hypothetical protein
MKLLLLYCLDKLFYQLMLPLVFVVIDLHTIKIPEL